MNKPDNSENLIYEFNNGNNSSFEKLIKKEELFINKILLTLLNNNFDDINDVKQEIFLSLYQNLKKFNYNSTFKTYLYKFVKNKAVDFLRKQNRINKIKNHVSNNCFEKEYKSVEESYLKEDGKNQLYSALFKLKEDEKLLILLKDIEDYTIQEIADITKMNTGSIKSKLHRSRIKLFKIMKEINYE